MHTRYIYIYVNSALLVPHLPPPQITVTLNSDSADALRAAAESRPKLAGGITASIARTSMERTKTLRGSP